jgi:MFS family permease
MLSVGLIEGVAGGAAAVTKLVSGALSDRFRRRKPWVLLGYGMAAATKPVFPLAGSAGEVLAARLVDRVGKGLRGAPRDALVADLTTPQTRGAAYGLRQALDSVGAFLGPLAALLLLRWYSTDLRALLWLAAAPAFVAVLVLAVAVREPERHVPVPPRAIHWGALRSLSGAYWTVVAASAALTLARPGEAFLVLRAADRGLALGQVPWVVILMNVVYAATAYPAGALADRVSSRRLLLAGCAVLALGNGVLAAAARPAQVLVGAALWGLYLGLT